ncbi:hypothetical protein U9M48_036025 [Paspalum notatum var. saurae]|uniref:Uncharacterized protein n=1 Tax=Paspalum notatum var. saurae TaxID=547442 RepID=A0AAQ3X842_PASNO
MARLSSPHSPTLAASLPLRSRGRDRAKAASRPLLRNAPATLRRYRSPAVGSLSSAPAAAARRRRSSAPAPALPLPASCSVVCKVAALQLRCSRWGLRCSLSRPPTPASPLLASCSVVCEVAFVSESKCILERHWGRSEIILSAYMFKVLSYHY